MLTIDVTGTEATLCKLLALRQQVGIRKYRVTVRDNGLSLRQWMVHALEEALDFCVYLARAIEEIDRREDDQR